MAECFYSGAIAVGIIIGFIVMAFLHEFLTRINWAKFKTYFLKCDEEKKKIILTSFELIETEYDKLARNTNTALFKTKYNTFKELITYIKKFRLN